MINLYLIVLIGVTVAFVAGKTTVLLPLQTTKSPDPTQPSPKPTDPTVPPTPPKPVDPKTEIWQVNGTNKNTCSLVKFALQLQIPYHYVNNKTTELAFLDIPEDASSSLVCENGTEGITLTWKQNVTNNFTQAATLTFSENSTIHKYYLQEINVKVVPDSSAIPGIIGLDFLPMPPESNVESSLVWFKASDPENIKYWKSEVDTFLQPYTNEKQDTDPVVVNCSPGVAPALGSNKIFGWKPEFYNISTIPHHMPDYLQNTIRAIESYQGPEANDLKIVWVSCEGETPTDVENIGPINYHPKFGFDGKYFPFLNVDNYLSPLVAVHFENPARGVLINIECKAWARNIVHDRQNRHGSVHFQLMVDY